MQHPAYSPQHIHLINGLLSKKHTGSWPGMPCSIRCESHFTKISKEVGTTQPSSACRQQAHLNVMHVPQWCGTLMPLKAMKDTALHLQVILPDQQSICVQLRTLSCQPDSVTGQFKAIIDKTTGELDNGMTIIATMRCSLGRKQYSHNRYMWQSATESFAVADLA